VAVVHSDDRRYWWDGREWQLAVSPDGRLWFDGARWIANPLGPPPVQYLPTWWTLPLQAAVIALTVIGFATFVAMAGLMVSRLPEAVVVGNLSPEQTAQLTRRMRASMISGIVTNGLVVLTLVVLIVIGALMRWRWMFWVTLAGFGLIAAGPLVGLAASVLIPVRPPTVGTLPPLPPPPVRTMAPAPTFSLALSLAAPLEIGADLLLFVWMLVMAVRIGPWACRRTVAA